MPDEKDLDERVSLAPLSGEEALKALLEVDPDSEPETEPSEPEDDRCPVEGWGVNGVQRCTLKVDHGGTHQFVPGQ